MCKHIKFGVLLTASALISFSSTVSARSTTPVDKGAPVSIKVGASIAQNSTPTNNAKPLAKSQFSHFAPRKVSSPAKIDYEVMDVALHDVVLRMGQSIRVRERRPVAMIGTRLVKGHTSPYRLEGSRVMFSYLSDNFTKGLTAYREDLVSIANTVDLQSLNKNEQLAYWFNLHNVLLIETIAKNYPKKRPSEILIGPDKIPLHDAKLITIDGIPLSLRNIREDIVYQNWTDPNVIYGFFHGDIGGPGLMNYAITGSNVDTVTKQLAFEFVNSLRGFHISGSARNVSKIYEKARPYFFKNWPQDLETHLKSLATEDVLKELDQDKPIHFARYDSTIADLMAGTPPTLFFNSSINGYYSAGGVPPEIQRLAAELQRKTRRMRKRGMLQGLNQVIITDIPTVDVDRDGVEKTPKKP